MDVQELKEVIEDARELLVEHKHLIKMMLEDANDPGVPSDIKFYIANVLMRMHMKAGRMV